MAERDETQLYLVRFRPGNDFFLRGLTLDFFFNALAALGSLPLVLKSPFNLQSAP